MKKRGVFNISLDFELHWGCFDGTPVLNEAAKKYFINTRNAIPETLSIFKEGGIHVTWATVGMLYNKNIADWEANKPQIIPEFNNPKVSAYEWIKANGFFDNEDPFHFAPAYIEMIKNTPHQEIGTHTYAHYFCLEEGQTKAAFEADIQKACALAKASGITIKSLVFPRNQFNPTYLSVCKEAGITSIRSNPDIWYWAYSNEAGSFMKRFFRAGDAYLKFQPIKKVYLSDIDVTTLPIQLPAARLYRPWRPKYPIENKLKMRRILNEMTAAAKSGAYYHIWWHPENFGHYPTECLQELRTIVNHFNDLHQKYGFETLTMEETTNRLLQQKNQA